MEAAQSEPQYSYGLTYTGVALMIITLDLFAPVSQSPVAGSIPLQPASNTPLSSPP